MIEPIWNRNHIASCRSRWPRASAWRTAVTSTIRSAPCASGRQPSHAAGRARRDGGARESRRRHPQGRQVGPVQVDPRRPTRSTTCAASTTAIERSTGSPRTRTHRDLRGAAPGRSTTGAGRGCRGSSARASACRSPQTELRAVFRDPPRLGFMEERHRHPEPNQFVLKLDPSTGTRLVLRRATARTSPAPSRSGSTSSSPTEGGEAPTPYEVLLLDAMRGDSTRFARQDGVEETWRIFEPLLDRAAARAPLRARHMGPDEAEKLPAGYGHWTTRGCRREPVESEGEVPRLRAPGRRQAGRARRQAAADGKRSAGRRVSAAAVENVQFVAPSSAALRDVAVPADRRLRVPVRLPHGGAGRSRRLGGLAVRATLRRPQRVRNAARPPGRLVPARPLRHQRALGARSTSPARTSWRPRGRPPAAGCSCATR